MNETTARPKIAKSSLLIIVLAGKAHPRDDDGKRLIEQLHAHARALEGSIPVAYLHDTPIRDGGVHPMRRDTRKGDGNRQMDGE